MTGRLSQHLALALSAPALTFAGIALPNDVASQSLAAHIGFAVADGKRDVGDAFSYGLTVGEQIYDRFAVEVTVSTSNHEVASGGELDLPAVMVDGIFSFRIDEPLSPFVSLGAGALNNDASRGRSDASFAAQLGVGARIELWKQNTYALNLVPHLRARWDTHGFPTNGDQIDLLTTVGLQWVWNNEGP